MKTRSKTPTGGVLMRPLDKKPGRLSRNGCGTCAWNWGICLSRRRCARPSLLLPSKRSQRHKGQGKAMASLRLPCAFKAGRFSGAGLRPPTRRDAALPRWQDAAPNRAASRSRWQSARALQRQDPRLSWLPKASAVSVEGRSNHEGASHQCPASSSPGWSRTFALAGLEPERTPARLYAARATPTHRGELVATPCSFATRSCTDPFPPPAGPRSPLVGRAAGSQHTSSHSQSGDDQTVRCPRRLCHLARFGDGVTLS
jgi:hypothetical protein